MPAWHHPAGLKKSNGVKPENLQLSKELWRSGFWAPLAVFVAHVTLSLTFNAYERLPEVDIPVHFVGGIAIAFFFYRTLGILSEYDIVNRVDGLVRAVLLVALTATAAVLWEFAEYASDHVIGTHTQEGLEDTLLDMLLGLLGGFTMVSFLWMNDDHGATRRE